MSRAEILQYLKFGAPPADVWRSFVKAMELGKGGVKSRQVTRFPVKINRNARQRLYPFSDYFLGFENADSVKGLLGDAADEVLAQLQVEFIDSPFPGVYPSDVDGHLIVTSEYFRKGALHSLYLDTFLSLAMIKMVSRTSLLDTEAEFDKNPAVLRAYSMMVEEARRLSIGDEELLGRLQLPRFMLSPSQYRRFIGKLGIKSSG